METVNLPGEIALIQKAISFSARAHIGQLRKDGQTPYGAHPMRVFFIVRHVFEIEDTTALCAALLHDTIEDTTTDYDDLLEEFGADVADAVAALTKDMRLPEAQREADYDAGLLKASWQARAVKLADTYDNTSDAHSSDMRAGAAKKAYRAISCAGDEPELIHAVKQLRALLGE